jgi:FKBP-type peptidyl-prolyl cis-trans isomerase 2
VFDTTDPETAKKAGMTKEASSLGPVVICLGEKHILPAIEEKIFSSGLGEFKIELAPEQAFGKKNAKLLKLMPLKVFKKQNLNPYPGLEVNMDNAYGIIRSVSGGRVIVDFNHPLSGKNVRYDVKVNKIIEDATVKAKAVFKNEMNIPEIKLEMKEDILHADEKIPLDVLELLKKRLMELIPEIKDIVLMKKEHIHDPSHEHNHEHTH